MSSYKSNVNPAFRSKFSEDIFLQKYRHEKALTWDELAKTCAIDVCSGFLKKDEVEQIAEYISKMYFIPGGRYLYYAGRQRKFFNNCASGDTNILTRDGFVRMETYEEGEKLEVYSPVTHTYLSAIMHKHGVQPLYEITFKNLKGYQQKEWKVKFTKDHKWPTARGKVEDLRIGDVVYAANVDLADSVEGYLHGLIYADGNVHVLKNSFGHQLRLCGAKAKYLPFVKDFGTVTYPEFANGDPILYVNSGINFKELPETYNTQEYIASFIKGWADLDGHFGIVNQIHTISKEAIDFFNANAFLCGYIPSGNIKVETRPSNFGERKPLYRVNFKFAENMKFKVTAIDYYKDEEVYCPFEPLHNRIVVDYGIDTYQCFLLKSEEDSREDWANLSWKAESCLTTGGGIGNDYSIYRSSGSILRGTGGNASGPVSKMRMINEIGREVMQGGSRRSAIYASLNWKHEDIDQFLVCKDWHSMKAGSSGLTLWDLKQQDFNFHAPLDMTNVSVNYDNKWLLDYWNKGELSEVFIKNVRQALSSGEPGFSFNFFGKENETLRNACHEICSEDDSDVCNLGSLNLSRIPDLPTFCDVVNLATKFLMCGTFVAELPYEKVKKIREKNRRLGLGLMGIHEWLVQRGYGYEVTPELHRWLTVYRDVSDATARTYSTKSSCSAPVGRRAVAPTGSIGILAGTSTGIEPIFATAYKRRFLKGTKWHYQLVVDGAAQDLVDRYGVNPDTLDTALSLSQDYERRIKFQADVQDYVDMGISSTINIPAWGSEYNGPHLVEPFAKCLASYAHRLRGFTCYSDGSRGGQPLSPVPYSDAVKKLGETFEEHVETHDICEITGQGGSCSV